MTDALEHQLANVPFTGGLSTKLDPYQLPFNKLAAAKDVVFTSPGQIQTRFGYKALSRALAQGNRFGPTVPAITEGSGLFSYGDELLQCDPYNLYSWDQIDQRWVYKSPCTSMNITTDAVVKNSSGQINPDLNTAPNGMRLNAWEDTAGGAYWSVTNTLTNTTVIPPTLIHADATKVKVLVIGGRFALLYVRTDTDLIYLASLPYANVYGGLTTNAITSGSTPSLQINATYESYDATVIPNTIAGAILYVAFCNNVASTLAGVTILGFSANNLSTATYSVVKASLVPRQLGIFADTIAPGVNEANGPIVFFADGSQAKVFGYQWSLVTATFGTTQVDSSIPVVTNLTGASVSDDGTRLVDLYWTARNSVSQLTLTKHATLTGATPTVSSVVALYRSVGLASKAFATTHGGKTLSFAVLAYQSIFASKPGFLGLQDTYFVGDSTGYMCGRFFYGTAGGLPFYDNSIPTGFPMLPEVGASSATLFHVALTNADFLTTVGQVGDPPNAATFSRTTPAPGTQAPLTAVFTQDGVVSVTFDFFDRQNSYLTAQLGVTLLLGGGLLQSYDGQTLTENDLSQAPENIAAPTQGTGGNLTLLGEYWYTFVWQWANAQGEIQQSAPSVPFPVTLTSSNNKLTFTVPTLRMTNKANVVLIAYRSQLVASVVGTVFQQALSTVVPVAATGTNAPVLNDKTADTITFVDILSDTLLGSNPNLYTTGNVIENLPTPPCSDLTVNFNRLFALASDSENLIAFSQQTLRGDPVQMSEWLEFNVDPRGGKATAVRALDQHTILFKESLIMAVDGIGPDATGGQGGFGEAYIVTTDCGCIYPRSIGLGPNGIYFLSAKGIAHIDRALQVTYIGWEAQALVNGNEATSAQIIAYTQQMRFTLNTGVLVGHDYFVNQWFEHTNVSGIDATIWLGQYAYLRSDGIVMVENPPTPDMTIAQAMATYSDAGAFIGMSIESPWFPFGGLNGWARTWWAFLLGKVQSRCVLQVQVAYDQDPSVRQIVCIPVGPSRAYGTAIYGDGTYGGIFPDSVWRVQPNQQLSNAIKFYVTVLQAGGVIGSSLSLSGFTFEWGQSRTARRPNSSATYG